MNIALSPTNQYVIITPDNYLDEKELIRRLKAGEIFLEVAEPNSPEESVVILDIVERPSKNQVKHGTSQKVS